MLAASLPQGLQGFPDTNGHFGLANHNITTFIFGDPLVGYADFFKIFPNCIPPSSIANSNSHSYIAINLSKIFKPPWNHWFFHHFLTASTKPSKIRQIYGGRRSEKREENSVLADVWSWGDPRVGFQE